MQLVCYENADRCSVVAISNLSINGGGTLAFASNNASLSVGLIINSFNLQTNGTLAINLPASNSIATISGAGYFNMSPGSVITGITGRLRMPITKGNSTGGRIHLNRGSAVEFNGGSRAGLIIFS